jgi:hypothetical protein
VRFGFQLYIVLFWFGAEIFIESTLNIDRVCIVTFNEIRVIAIH